MWNTVLWVFNGFGVILLYQFIRHKIADYRSEDDKSRYWTIGRHRYVLSISGLLLLGLIILEFFVPETSPFVDESDRDAFNSYLSIVSAFAISAVWAVYLRKLDVFEPERWRHLIIVFVMGCITVWFVFPIADILNNWLHFDLNGQPLNDFAYSVIGIGMVEEFVKMIPLAIIVRFRRIVNEPYDYLLYASMSALGFAFIENGFYIESSDFLAMNGRALMSTVAHMTFSAVIGYGFMTSACRRRWQGWYYILGAFLLASFMHGFYNFWLINPVVQKWDGLTLLFFMLTTHYWFTLKNKAISASYFYDESITIRNDQVRYFLVTALVSILMISTLLIGFSHGSDRAHSFLGGQIFAYGFLIYYLSFSFSRFVIAPRALAVCQVVFDKTIPQEPETKAPEEWRSHHEERGKS